MLYSMLLFMNHKLIYKRFERWLAGFSRCHSLELCICWQLLSV